MSASNWTTCPRCADALAERKRAARAALDTAYGTVDREQYKAMEARVAVVEAEQLDQMFREDYEFYGAREGEVVADYGGECSVCGLEARLRQSVRFYETPGRPDGAP